MITRGSNDSEHNLAMDVHGVDHLRTMNKKNSSQALKESAKQFEALFINMMMQSMRQASPKGGLFESNENAMYTSMLDQQYSQLFAQRGMGFADMILKQLTKSNGIEADSALPQPTKYVESALSPQNSQTRLQAAMLSQLSHSLVSDTPKSGQIIDALYLNNKETVHGTADDFSVKMQEHAKQAEQSTGIPYSFILAQAAIESGWGKREITKADGSSSHNLFGIKAGSDWQGDVAEVTTTEYIEGVPRKVVARFRAYDSHEQAFQDYANFLKNNPRYSQVLINGQTAQGFAYGLQNAGYATDPAYATKLLKVIQKIEAA